LFLIVYKGSKAFNILALQVAILATYSDTCDKILTYKGLVFELFQ